MGVLRVRAKGLVPNIEAIEDGTFLRKDRRYIGQSFGEVKPGVFGFVPSGDVEVEDRLEYRRAVAEGALEAVDRATADLCGVKFGDAPAEPTKAGDAPSKADAQAPGKRIYTPVDEALPATEPTAPPGPKSTDTQKG